jgi:hypothetical protein
MNEKIKFTGRVEDGDEWETLVRRAPISANENH